MPRQGLQEVGSARITGSTAAIVWQTGCIASVARSGAGDWNITLGTDFGVDDTEMVASVQALVNLAASGSICFGVTSTSDTVKRVTALKEAALGAASALTDVDDFVITFRKRAKRS